MKRVLETKRLILREFEWGDAPFILELVNSPGWLTYIGDRNIHTIQAAHSYLQEGPMKSYQTHGYGLWLVALRDSLKSIGMCGLVNRADLPHVDIGFALLPAFMQKGYGFEIAQATLDYARTVLELDPILGITHPNNQASIQLLLKIGLKPTASIKKGEDDVLVFSSKHDV